MSNMHGKRSHHFAARLALIAAAVLVMLHTSASAADNAADNATLLAKLHAPETAVVAPWSGATDRTLIMWTAKATPDPKQPDFGVEMVDFHLRVAQTSTGRVLQRQDQRRVFTSDAIHFDGVKFDMTDFVLARNRPAFAVRIDYSHQGCDSMAQSDLRLYQVVRGRLRQVYAQAAFDESQGTCDCSGAAESENKLRVATSTTNGQADLLRDWREIAHNEGMVGEECVDHPVQKTGSVPLHFDGGTYRE